jgi:hypothetical protein
MTSGTGYSSLPIASTTILAIKTPRQTDWIA